MNDRRVNCIDALYGMGLFLITILSRLPFRSQILYHWDSVNFAFAIRHFDIASHQPQPPGYILYVWLGKLLNLAIGDAQTAFVWLSVGASGLAVVTMFYLGKAMFGRARGLIAALLLATSPLFWFYGEVALPHTLDTFFVILSAWLFYEVMRKREACLIPAVVILGIAGGLRQQTPVFLMPLAVFALRKVSVKRLILAILVFGLVCATWFFPMIWLTGGLTRYRQILANFSVHFDTRTSVFLGAGWSGLIYNLRKLTMYTLYGWNVALVPFGLYVLKWLGKRRPSPVWGQILFLFMWMAPPLFFYTFVHMGQQGLVFVFLPALLLLGAEASSQLLSPRGNRLLLVGATIALVAVNVGLFVLLPEYPFGGESFKVLSLDTLRKRDAYFYERFTLIETQFPPESTAIIARNWRHVEYYLPQYRLLSYDDVMLDERHIEGREHRVWSAADFGLQPDAEGVVAVVLFDDELGTFSQRPFQFRKVALPNGDYLSYFIVEEGSGPS